MSAARHRHVPPSGFGAPGDGRPHPRRRAATGRDGRRGRRPGSRARCRIDAVTTCLLGCDEELEPMARWAPYRACPTCGSGFFAPPPLDTYWGEGVLPSDRQDRLWTERSRQWAPVVGPGPGRVLDVGCGFGHFVRWAEDAGWDAWGYEPDQWSRDHAVCDSSQVVPTLADAPGPFDVITMWDVLEHSEDPLAFVRELAGHLAPGGRLV